MRRVIHYQPEQMAYREQTQAWCGRAVWGAKTTRLADCVTCKDCRDQMAGMRNGWDTKYVADARAIR